MHECPFCSPDESRIIARSGLCFALYDLYPVNKGHALIIPSRHFSSYFDALADEVGDMHALLLRVQSLINEKFSPDGYNIGINCGGAAGQTVMHMHIHLIPRYRGDIDDPRGGVRKLKHNLVEYPENCTHHK
ncbi:MAG: HIT family protein [Candidatus Eremiobacteraeota bacterium]|nr:HIT family protein [Candidatus Eremiobacteraeota bacterium]